MSNVKTYLLKQDVLWDNFGGHELFRSGFGVRMVRVTNNEAGVPQGMLPDLVFSQRLPKWSDGRFLDPTEMIPVPLAMVRLSLEKMPPFATQAYVLFGDLWRHCEYSCIRVDTDGARIKAKENDTVFYVTSAAPTHALIKVERDARVPQFFNEKILQAECEGLLGKEGPLSMAELRANQEFIFDTDELSYGYGICGTTYAMVKIANNSVLRRLHEQCRKRQEAWLQTSERTLEVFDQEKKIWEQKILNMIPKGWVAESPKTRKVETTSDEVRISVEVSPAYWREIVNARFDARGKEKVHAALLENGIITE